MSKPVSETSKTAISLGCLRITTQRSVWRQAILMTGLMFAILVPANLLVGHWFGFLVAGPAGYLIGRWL